MLIVHLCFCIMGIFSCFFLFGKLQTLSHYKDSSSTREISVIIPVRNEAHNLPGLLDDLQRQRRQPLECICVDDGSDDESKAVILKYGAKYVRIDCKSSEWLGKTYACHIGAKVSKGNKLLFLDADVRLEPDALERLSGCFEKEQSVISVQPFHKTRKVYEQVSFLFNGIVMAMAGSSKRIQKAPGLFGPVILMSAGQYKNCGGHGMVKKDVLDDIGLGECVRAAGISYKRFCGKGFVNFRMYPGGIKELIQGWVKNFAEGAVRISIPLLMAVILWITSLLRTCIELIRFSAAGNVQGAGIYIVLYLMLALQLLWVGKQVGEFYKLGVLLYPLLLTGFLIIFTVSAVRKVFRLPVYWKGRKIRSG